MNKQELSEEQIKDIAERVKKASTILKELQLTPAAQVSKTNLGNDIFGDLVTPYLQDIKYSGKSETEEVLKKKGDVPSPFGDNPSEPTK